MYFCLNRGTVGGSMPLDQFVKIAATAGFDGADVDFSYAVANGQQALKDLYAQHAMKFGGWAPGDWRHDETTAAHDLTVLDFHASVAARLGVDSCATWIMPSSDRPLMETWKFHVERLGAVARVLAGHGLRLGLEFVTPKHLRTKQKHEFVWRVDHMLQLAADCGPNVGLLVDCFHLHAAGEPIDAPARIAKNKIVLVHLNDAPTTPIDDLDDGNRLLPGDGVIDLDSFLTSLKTAGYDGPVSVEVFSEELRALPPEAAAKRAWKATERVAHLAGVL